jgi:hypothetical protein
VKIGLTEDISTKKISQRELALRYTLAATNIVENTKVVNAMELLNQTALTVVFGRECGKTIFQMDILQIRTRISGLTQGRQN